MGKLKFKGSCNFPKIKFMSKLVLKISFLIPSPVLTVERQMTHSINEMTIIQGKLL